MKRTVVQTPSAPKAIGPYSQAIVAEAQGLVYTAGQVGLVPETGEVVSSDVREQTRRALENVKAILEAAGSSMAGVVKTTVFLRSMNDFAAMNEVYGRYFAESPPARSTVEVSRLPKDVLVEIEAVGLVVRR